MTERDDPADAVLAVPLGLESFVRTVAAAPALQARLGPAETPDAFVALAAEIAAELGLPVDEPTLRGALRPDPLGLGRWGAAPITLPGWPTGDWLPTRSVPTEPPAFEWAWFGPRRLTEPFYEDAVRRDANRPMNLLLRTRTDLAALLAGATHADSVPLQGLVFHMSRCGSTLLARMLAAFPGHAVASEPEPLDAVLQWARTPGVGLDEAIAAVRAIVAALGRRRDPASRRFFIKLEAWHTLSLPLLRAAFPDVPWVYLYRDPIEVMVSQMDQPGIHTVPGAMDGAPLAIADAAELTREEHCAQVLALIGRAVVDNWSLGGGMVVDYRQLKSAALSAIPRHFGFSPDAPGHAAMTAAAGEYSKDPGRTFRSDSTRKQVAATPGLRDAVDVHLARLHDELAALTG